MSNTITATLIPVVTGNINGEAIELVNARTLHQFLDVKRDFNDWIKSRIQKYNFIENQDFILILQNGSFKKMHGGDRRSVDYHLTLDMAKEVAMVQRNEQGRQARRYFIAIEKQHVQALQHNVASTVQQSHLQNELLLAKPLWDNLKRYMSMGLNRAEMCLLTKKSSSVIRRNLRRMEACGLIQPPANLVQMRINALNFQGGLE